MKSKFISILLLLSSYLSYSQQEVLFDKYQNIFGEEVDINIYIDENGGYKLLIDANTNGDYIEKAGIAIDKNWLVGFLSSIQEAKVIYEDWSKKAKGNNITDYQKVIDIPSIIAGGYFFYEKQWVHDKTVMPSFLFRVVKLSERTEYLLYINTGELTDEHDDEIKCKNVYLLFNSLATIDVFTETIKKEKADTFVKKKVETDKLFND